MDDLPDGRLRRPGKGDRADCVRQPEVRGADAAPAQPLGPVQRADRRVHAPGPAAADGLRAGPEAGQPGRSLVLPTAADDAKAADPRRQ